MNSLFSFTRYMVMTLILSACQTNVESFDSSTNTLDAEKNETFIDEEPEWTAEEIAEMENETAAAAEAEEIYMSFTQEVYDSMLGEKPFALFFHASWCPTCQVMENDILANIKTFPEGAVILKADYDTETALKEKYGISSQSLVVMIDADGTVAETLVAPSASALESSFASLLK